MRSIVPGLNRLWAMDSVPAEPQPVAMRDSVSVYGQLTFDFVIDGPRGDIGVAVVSLGCSYQIDYFAIQFVPFCRSSACYEDRTLKCFRILARRRGNPYDMFHDSWELSLSSVRRGLC